MLYQSKISLCSLIVASGNFHNFLIDIPLIGCYNINIKNLSYKVLHVSFLANFADYRIGNP